MVRQTSVQVLLYILVNVADRHDLSFKKEQKKIYLLQNCDLLSKSQNSSFVIYLLPLGSSLLTCIIIFRITKSFISSTKCPTFIVFSITLDQVYNYNSKS